MKSRIVEVNKSEYPKLMILSSGDDGRGMIVLFTESRCGTVVREAGGQEHGYTSNSWHMPHFEDFHGEVTLSND